jgi:hypothetical protein
MIIDQIISYFQEHPEGIDDDELALILGLKSRQQANKRCRILEAEGRLVRRKVNGKIQNFWVAGKPTFIKSVSLNPQEPIQAQNKFQETNRQQLWYWEGNIQSKVINYLAKEGFQIRSVADTANHQRGIDIIAEKGNKQLWVSVKGFPQGTDKTSASVQASHWFKQVIFDVLEYRQRDRNVVIAVALPDFSRYRSMTQKITWLKPVANFVYFWVNESGEIVVE